MKTILLTLVLFYASLCDLVSQPTAWRQLNFQGAGYVTGIYPAFNNGPASQQVLYCRTDIGGIYRSGDNGNTWTFVSCYYRQTGQYSVEFSPSELLIQGMVVRPTLPNDQQTIIVAWGGDINDAVSAGYQCLWKSNNNGNTGSWYRPVINIPSGEGLAYTGNTLGVKLGGECIIYDPNREIQSFDILYTGGMAKDNLSRPRIFKSLDGGETWSALPHFANIGDTITCIAMKSGSNEVWVGVTNGTSTSCVYRSTDGTNFSLVPNFIGPSVRRILLAGSSPNHRVFVAYGLDQSLTSTQGIAMTVNNGASWTNLTPSFDGNYNYGNAGGIKTYFSTMLFYNNDETQLLAGRYGRPIRMYNYSTNTWSGIHNFNGEWQYLFYYDAVPNYPNHQFNNEPWVYTGLNNVVQNRNAALSGNWYSSGGASPYRSINGGILTSSTWQYIPSGINMPVVYDISFEPIAAPSRVLIPISDWTMGHTTDLSGNSALLYDRQSTTSDPCPYPSATTDTYIPNVTRAIFSPYTQWQYIIGGNVYTHTAKMYRRRIGFSNFKLCSTPWNYKCDRVLNDGLCYALDANNDRIVLLLGASEKKKKKTSPAILCSGVPQPYSDLGVYYGTYNRSNDSYSFTAASFAGSDGMDFVSQAIYENSFMGSPLPPPDGFIGDQFSQQFNFAHNPSNNPHVVYIYLEDGGVFKSNDGAVTWNHISDVTTGYRDEGCLKLNRINNELWLAIKNRGLFRSLDGVTWSPVGGFSSAQEVDVLGISPAANSKIAVFGKRTGDNLNNLYYSVNNGSTWTRIPVNPVTAPLPVFPFIRSLRIRPDIDNELWIATAGQGVNIFNQLGTATNPQPWIISTEVTVNSSMYNDREIRIVDGGHLIIQGTPDNHVLFDMGPRPINVQQGGRLTANYVDFNCPLEGYTWQGILMTNAITCSIQNSTFRKTAMPVKIYNDNANYFSYLKFFKGNTFNVADGGFGARGILAQEVANLVIDGNTFNLTNANAMAIEVANTVSPPGGAGDAAAPSLQIINNIFSGGEGQVRLDCFLAGLTNFYVYNNYFNGSSNGTGTGLWAWKISGKIKNNRFNSSQYSYPAILLESNVEMFGNRIYGQSNQR